MTYWVGTSWKMNKTLAEGLAFADTLYQQGGWPAVDAAYDRLPESTEQILHPEKYLAEEGPKPVEASVTVDDLGDGWTERRADSVGELGISVWLESSAGPAVAAEAAAGWGGDRAVLLEGPDEAWLLSWLTSWDTPADAEEFTAAAADLLDELFPEIMLCTPDWIEVEAGRYPPAKNAGPADPAGAP